MLFRKARERAALAQAVRRLVTPPLNLGLSLPWDDDYFVGFLFGFGSAIAGALGITGTDAEIGDRIIYGIEALAPKEARAGMARRIVNLKRSSAEFDEGEKNGAQAAVVLFRPEAEEYPGMTAGAFYTRVWPDMADQVIGRMCERL